VMSYPYQYLSDSAPEPAAPEPVVLPANQTPGQPAYIIVNYAPPMGQYQPPVHPMQVEDQPQETKARLAMLVGWISCLFCLPLSICGLIMARNAQRQIGNNPAHPEYSTARKAVCCNRLVLALWLALMVVGTISASFYYYSVAQSYDSSDSGLMIPGSSEYTDSSEDSTSEVFTSDSSNTEGGGSSCDLALAANLWSISIQYHEGVIMTQGTFQSEMYPPVHSNMKPIPTWIVGLDLAPVLNLTPNDIVTLTITAPDRDLKVITLSASELLARTPATVKPNWKSIQLSFNTLEMPCTDFP